MILTAIVGKTAVIAAAMMTNKEDLRFLQRATVSTVALFLYKETMSMERSGYGTHLWLCPKMKYPPLCGGYLFNPAKTACLPYIDRQNQDLHLSQSLVHGLQFRGRFVQMQC